MNLGKAIKIHRIEIGWSAKRLSIEANICSSYVCLIEKNKRDPNISVIRKIATAFNMKLSELIIKAEKYDE